MFHFTGNPCESITQNRATISSQIIFYPIQFVRMLYSGFAKFACQLSFLRSIYIHRKYAAAQNHAQ